MKWIRTELERYLKSKGVRIAESELDSHANRVDFIFHDRIECKRLNVNYTTLSYCDRLKVYKDVTGV